MKDVDGELLILNKNVGETPLECMDRFRAENPGYADIKMTYAGRLDPIASGVLLVLTGEKVYEKEKFLGLPKTYQCTAILGVATDTYDILGVIQIFQVVTNKKYENSGDGSAGFSETWQAGMRAEEFDVPKCDFLICNHLGSVSAESFDRIRSSLMSFLGTWEQSYPPYSSKTINGKQLHTISRDMLARGEGEKVAEMATPKQRVTVTDIFNVSLKELPLDEVIADIIATVQKVTGDFRQEEIIAGWKNFAEEYKEWENSLENEKSDTLGVPKLAILEFSISVSGGTYIRGIVNELGKKLGCGACIWKLHRTKAGDYDIINA